MSRIDEALRRAALEQTDDTGDLPLPRPIEADEVTTLAREPFPVELAAHSRRRPPASPPEVGEEPQARDKTAAGGEGRTAEEPRRTLFERIDASLAEKVVADENMSQMSREQYRRLAAVLHDAQGSNGLRILMVASAVPGEGKTLTASNVALTLSESYKRRVLLIDADLRKPTLHQVFRLNTASGLIDGLEAQTDVKVVLRQVSPYLSVLPAGRPTPDPMAGLTSERMQRLLEDARQAFDWVIIDTPPLMLLPDAHLLSTMVDGAVLVVRANSTPFDMVKRTADAIGRPRIIGVVLNQAETTMQPGYGGYYGGYYLDKGETRPRT